MVNQDVVEGLRSAVAKGESMNQAMISFYNAGYTKAEIEEAAKVAQTQPLQPVLKAVPVTSVEGKAEKSVEQPKEEKKEEKKKETKQNVSKYEGKKKKSGSTLIIILAVFLFLLVGVLTTIFLLKDQLIELLNKIF